jgi:hypothetical protein
MKDAPLSYLRLIFIMITLNRLYVNDMQRNGRDGSISGTRPAGIVLQPD